MSNTPNQSIENYLLQLQDTICNALAKEDGTETFKTDLWDRPEGGGGRSCTLADGQVIEKGGVNFSHVYGENLPPAATAARSELSGCHFEAMGVSSVIHPRNPYAPTTHLNIRFFSATKPGAAPIWWFGGGFDLTPYYGFIEDCKHWHQVAKQACDPFGLDLYPKYKKWADDYFFLKHRKEPRGIGGIFFDDVNTGDFEQCFGFLRSIGDNFLQAYLPLLSRRKNHSYGQHERDFQLYRRGRYVEFNLLYDRGTLFGLQSGGRTESILMSLPPCVNWVYNWHPQPDTEESRLYDYYLIPRDWINEK